MPAKIILNSHPVALATPVTDQELHELQSLLEQIPAPLEPLDACMLDGYLCGVLVQPVHIPNSRWLPYITDVDGRVLPAHAPIHRLHELALKRHAELNAAIERRDWFDPWVFELDDDAAAPVDDDGDEAPPEVEAVYPWVAGFVTAMEAFPGLMDLGASELTEPLALLYRHLAPEDLEEADELLAEIESLEPPASLTDAVEGLVRATLLLADLGRPLSGLSGSPERRPSRRAARAKRS